MTCFTWNCSPSMPSMAARAYITQIKQKFSCHSKHQQQNPKVLRLLLPSRLSLKSCTISFSHLCRSRTWQKQILATKTVLKVTNHSACNSMLLQKSPKYPAWWLPRYPNFHNVTILFELSCEILAQWSLHESAEKPIPVPKDPGRINVNIPGYFEIRLTLMQSSYSFMIQKNVALLSFEKVLVYAFLPTNLSSKIQWILLQEVPQVQDASFSGTISLSRLPT